jgi:hypothetical protein
MRNKDTVTILGIIALIYWGIDVINNIFFLNASSWSLWFSSVGIGLTAVGLLTRNAFLLNSLFCALFVGESFWNIGFFSHLLFGKSFMGLTDYLFNADYTTKDFFITSYHIIMIPFLLIGILKEKIIYKLAWLGATGYITILSVLTYFLVGQKETVNCVHTIENCRAFLFFLDKVNNPLRITIGISLATLLLFIPTNYLLVQIVKRLRFLNLQ